MLKGTCRITVISTPLLAPVHRMDLTESESKKSMARQKSFLAVVKLLMHDLSCFCTS